MMTAMQASSLPAAILRSGRIEVWLETRLPDEQPRAEMLRMWLAEVPEPLASVNVAAISQASKGLTGADLKAVVEDAKLLYAFHMSTGAATKHAEHYFLDAIEGIRGNRRGYAEKRRVDLGESEPIGFPCIGEQFNDEGEEAL
jgi:ATP-dependent 26S proteasome regulatory subunit